MATSPARTDRWKALDFGPPPSDAEEPDLPVLVEYTQDEKVAVITLNRPHADNAITTAMGARLTEILETIAVRLSVRAVILTGAGQRAFSVGSDLRQRKDMTKQDWLRQRQDFDRTLYTVRQLRKPIFTAVNGIAYGGGCELAQSTDFIIASDNATFGQPEAMLGLAAGGGSPALLPRVLPPGKAMQMLMTGDPISAQEAHRLGMVNEIYAQDELLDAAHRIAAKIASNSPTAVQAVKQAVRMGQGEPIPTTDAIPVGCQESTEPVSCGDMPWSALRPKFLPVIRGQRGEDESSDRSHVGRVRVAGAPPRRDRRKLYVHGAADQAW